jgi:aminoglycoside/choline kinase family phosphotransferase
MDHMINNTSWSKFQANFDIRSPNTPFTLCHGDFHAGNVMWSRTKTGPPCSLVDWSEAGIFCPFTELAQFLVSHASIELRRKHELQLVRAHYERLAVPAATFPFSDCWERYKAGGLERWLQLLVLLAVFGLDKTHGLPESGVQWFHDQVAAFAEDHADSCKRPLMLMTGYRIS